MRKNRIVIGLLIILCAFNMFTAVKYINKYNNTKDKYEACEVASNAILEDMNILQENVNELSEENAKKDEEIEKLNNQITSLNKEIKNLKKQ